jgi:hypothetical protein
MNIEPISLSIILIHDGWFAIGITPKGSFAIFAISPTCNFALKPISLSSKPSLASKPESETQKKKKHRAK